MSDNEDRGWKMAQFGPFYDPCGCGHSHGPFDPGRCPSRGEMAANLAAYKQWAEMHNASD